MISHFSFFVQNKPSKTAQSFQMHHWRMTHNCIQGWFWKKLKRGLRNRLPGRDHRQKKIEKKKETQRRLFFEKIRRVQTFFETNQRGKHFSRKKKMKVVMIFFSKKIRRRRLFPTKIRGAKTNFFQNPTQGPSKF